MSYFAGQADFELSFGINAISLVNGIASQMPGQSLPLSTLIAGNLGTGQTDALDDAFGKFYPLPGTSLIENQLGQYPFASQVIAANSIIKMPIKVSLLMRCPVRWQGGYGSKLSIMTSLQNTLADHCARGGTFIVATPVFFYTDVILVGLHNVNSGETLQPMIAWRWDFEKPLISGAQAAGALSPFMSSLSSGGAISGDTSGLSLASPPGVGSPSVTPSQTSAASTGVPAAGVVMNNPAGFG